MSLQSTVPCLHGICRPTALCMCEHAMNASKHTIITINAGIGHDMEFCDWQGPGVRAWLATCVGW